MTRKRMIKLLMSIGCDRNDAVKAANLCDGRVSHAVMYRELYIEFARALRVLQRRLIIEGDMTGAVAGMVGSVYE